MSNLYPIGSILAYGAPVNTENENALIGAGYIPCDGRTLSRTDPQYAALFSVINLFYGGTDAEFCVPDFRGRFMRGTDLSAGRDPDSATRTEPTSLQYPGNSGDNVGSLQQDAVQGHSHNYTQGGKSDHNAYNGAETPGVFSYSNQDTASSSASGGSETRPKNAYVNYVIVFM